MSFSDHTEVFDPAWHARRTDPSTSHQAAVRLNRTEISELICDAIVYQIRRVGPQTDQQLERALTADPTVGPYVTPSGMRTRRKRLERIGILYDTGYRKNTDTGRKAIVWGLVGHGFAQTA